MVGDNQREIEKRAWSGLFVGLSDIRSIFGGAKYGLQIVGTIAAGAAGFLIEGKVAPALHYFQALGGLGLHLVAAGVIIDWRLGDKFTNVLSDTRAAIEGWSDEIRLKEEALDKARDSGRIGSFDVTQGTGGARNLAIAKNFDVLVNSLLIASNTGR